MKEIIDLAVKLGFKPKTVTTIYTAQSLKKGNKYLINDTCEYLLLCEIQKWLIDLNAYRFLHITNSDDYYEYFKHNIEWCLNELK